MITDDGFYIGYLMPGDYAVRLYVTDSLYIELPGLYEVSAGVVGLIDLTPLTDTLELLVP